MKRLIRFFNDTSGATAIEYGLLASLISVALIVGLGAFADSLLGIFERITETINGAWGK